jgi:hypothetical protein
MVVALNIWLLLAVAAVAVALAAVAVLVVFAPVQQLF